MHKPSRATVRRHKAAIGISLLIALAAVIVYGHFESVSFTHEVLALTLAQRLGSVFEL